LSVIIGHSILAAMKALSPIVIKHIPWLLVPVGIALAVALESCYLPAQAARFLAIQWSARSFDSVNRSADDATKAFLSRVDDIRGYATDELGLRKTGNYTKYVALDRDWLAFVVSACADDSFARHDWSYPFLGALPYRGFYAEKDARGEAKKLKAKGLDVLVRKVDAFSTLGYFRDPLFSFMEGYSEGELAETIIHESAHATLFLGKDSGFNEEFATFVGRQGALSYLQSRFGSGSPQAKAYVSSRRDGTAFAAYLKETARLLEAQYARVDLDRAGKLAAKASIVAERAAEFRASPAGSFESEGYRNFDMSGLDNAWLDLYRLYEEDLTPYSRWFENRSGGDMPRFIADMKALSKKGPGTESMKARLADGSEHAD